MTDLDDATLVERAVEGDASAFAALYDRYAGSVFGMASRMLRDQHEAADVTSDVFLIAAERLGQLRDRAKVRAWLLAVTRNEVYRVSRRRTRVVATEGLEMTAADTTDTTDTAAEATTDPEAARRLVLQAADGLDARDRTVLELNLAGLDGEELSAALGVTTSNAYQLTHRMKDRLERSVGALFVARQGRADCDALTALLRDWDGTFSVRWRKRVARHVDGCETCDARRRRIPAAVVSGRALAAGAPAYALAPPARVRADVLDNAPDRLARPAGHAWPHGGWPSTGGRGGRTVRGLAAVAVVMLVGLGIWGLTRADRSSEFDQLLAAEFGASNVPPTSTGPGPSRGEFDLLDPESDPSETTVPPSDEPGPGPSNGPDQNTPPDDESPIEPAEDTTAPTLELTGPPVLHQDSCLAGNDPFIVSATDDVGVVRVELRWRVGTKTTASSMVKVNQTWQRVVNPPYESGTVYVTAVAYDAAGNSASSDQLAVPTDCPGPL